MRKNPEYPRNYHITLELTDAKHNHSKQPSDAQSAQACLVKDGVANKDDSEVPVAPAEPIYTSEDECAKSLLEIDTLGDCEGIGSDDDTLESLNMVSKTFMLWE